VLLNQEDGILRFLLVLNQWWLLATFFIASVEFDATDLLLLTYSHT
jgi:hypothetical protein